MISMLVGGYLLTRPSDSYSAEATASQVGFNHPQKYQQIHGGAGTRGLSASVRAWSSGIAGKFDGVAQRLEEAGAKAGVAWEGRAAEAHGSSLGPLSSFVRDAKDVSTAVGTSTGQQVDNFAHVRDTMPEPKKITATDSLLEKGAAALFGNQTDLQRQEQEAMQRAQEAQRIYGNYQTGSSNVSSSLPPLPEAPKTTFEADRGGGRGRVGVDGGTGYTGNDISGGGTYSGGGSGSADRVSEAHWSTGGSSGMGRVSEGHWSTDGSAGGGSGSDGGSGDDGPAGNDSSWVTPPSTGGPTPLPGTGAPGTGTPGTSGPGVGVIGGLGAGSGRGGSGSGRGGTGGYGRGGTGSGAGGRSGSGMPSTSSAYSSSTSSTGARGGAMAGAGARGAQGEEDEEHENKYMVPTDEAWDDLGLPRTAPPVIGGDLEPPQR